MISTKISEMGSKGILQRNNTSKVGVLERLIKLADFSKIN